MRMFPDAIPGPGARIGSVLAGLPICKDMHFAAIARDYGRIGAHVVLAPSWDFGEDAVYAARLSAARGRKRLLRWCGWRAKAC